MSNTAVLLALIGLAGFLLTIVLILVVAVVGPRSTRAAMGVLREVHGKVEHIDKSVNNVAAPLEPNLINQVRLLGLGVTQVVDRLEQIGLMSRELMEIRYQLSQTNALLQFRSAEDDKARHGEIERRTGRVVKG